MVTKHRLRRIFIPIALYICAISAIGFFAYSAYHGSRGIVAKREYKEKIALLASSLDSLQQERKDWERRVNLLRSESLDRDILEERARLLLNSASRNDVIVILDNKR